MPEKLLNIKEVMEALGVSESTLFRLLRAKKLKGFKVGREWRFQEKDIDAFIQGQREAQQKEKEDQTGQLAVTR